MFACVLFVVVVLMVILIIVGGNEGVGAKSDDDQHLMEKARAVYCSALYRKPEPIIREATPMTPRIRV